MRKADRLFEIIQILRRSKKPVTADAMAAELETSKRSVYRDIAALLAQRVGHQDVAEIVGADGNPQRPDAKRLDEQLVLARCLNCQLVAGLQFAIEPC